MEVFSRRVWLNPEWHPYTGSIVVYDGPARRSGDNENQAFVEVSDCHQKVCLHEGKACPRDEFIEKVKLMHKTLGEFILHLESSEK